MKKFMYLFLFLFLISFVSATCTVTFDKTFPSPYNPSATIIATMNCTETNEKNTAYALTWYNGTNDVLENDTGTTPAVQGTDFFQTYTIASDYTGNITANLTGTNLEGSAMANVSGSSVNSLIITDPFFSPNARLGSIFAVDLLITDENNKKLSNAHCKIYGTDSNDAPLQTCGETHSHDGRATCDGILSNEFIEGNEYIAKVQCSCGLGDDSCVDEDGNLVNASAGSTAYPFTISTWLTVNTVTDLSLYVPKQEIFICANVTNVDFTSRIPLKIFYQVRCSQGTDNDDDLDRVLIISDDNEPDFRGIGVGQTQMQCKRFVMPQVPFLEGRSSECYASTSVWNLDNSGMERNGYHTNSSVFTYFSNALNIEAFWDKVDDYKINTIINLSSNVYSNYNATSTNGSIDIRLNDLNPSSIKHSEQYGGTAFDISKIIDSLAIKSVTATNLTGDLVPTKIQYNEDGLIELEISGVNINRSSWYNVTIEFNSWGERSSTALEGIENKTGTFAFNITTTTLNAPNEINFDLYALLEISDQSQVEGFFSCYVEGYKDETEIQFNKAINKITPYQVTKTLTYPENLTGIQTVVCELGFIGFGNDKDISSDTFLIPRSGGVSSSVTPTDDDSTIEIIKEELKDIKEHVKNNSSIYVGILIILVLLIGWFLLRKKDEKN